MNCRVCATLLEPFFALGAMPLANAFLTREEIPREKNYDLTVGFCPHCHLVQLLGTVPPEALFSNYIYRSGISRSIVTHARQTAAHLVSRLRLGPESLVLEIASNDGTQLVEFKTRGVRILGIDPARSIARAAEERGIPTISEFFNAALARSLNKKGTVADLVYGANVLAHVPAVVDFLRGVKIVLASRGTAVFEVSYLRGLVENKFDTVYHEHVFYYSLLALVNLFRRANLDIYDAELIPAQGGSLRIFASHPGVFPLEARVTELVAEERREGFEDIRTYQGVAERVGALKARLIRFLEQLRRDGARIAAYGAPAKGNILLNYFGIGSNFLDFIVDKAKEKQGLYTPGTHLLVRAPEYVYKQRPDYLLILPWNIADEIMAQLKSFHDAGGKFIVPVPDIAMV